MNAGQIKTGAPARWTHRQVQTVDPDEEELGDVAVYAVATFPNIKRAL